MKIDIDQLKKELSDKGVEADKLAVIMLTGGEQLIGELQLPVGVTVFMDRILVMKNPKRLLRIQKMTPNGSHIQIDPFLGPLDMLENDGSMIEVKPVMGYWIHALKEPSQIAYFTAVLGVYRQMVVNSALQSGLSLPGHLARGGLSGKG